MSAGIEVQVALGGSREVVIPFQVGLDVIFFQLSCTTCGSKQFIMPDDTNSIICANFGCGTVPLMAVKNESSVKWVV